VYFSDVICVYDVVWTVHTVRPCRWSQMPIVEHAQDSAVRKPVRTWEESAENELNVPHHIWNMHWQAMRYLHKTSWQRMLQGPTGELAHYKWRNTGQLRRVVQATIVYVRSWKHAMYHAVGNHNAKNRCTVLLQTSATLRRTAITVWMVRHLMFWGARRTVNSERV